MVANGGLYIFKEASISNHRRTNKLHYLDSCVLTVLSTLICIKHNGDDKPEDCLLR